MPSATFSFADSVVFRRNVGEYPRKDFTAIFWDFEREDFKYKYTVKERERNLEGFLLKWIKNDETFLRRYVKN